MKLHKYSDTQLINELNKSKSFCDDLNRVLECIPETSILGSSPIPLIGRLGVSASLKRETKRYNELLEETTRRGLRK